jgi:hypothetical protein
MNRAVKVVAVVGVAAAVGGAVAWKLGLIGKKPADGFDADLEGGLVIDDYAEYDAEPPAFAEIGEAVEDDEDLEFDTLVGVDDGVEEEQDEPEEGPLLIDDEPDEEATLATGMHPALEDGSQPEGFPIKGNADSMKYHVPGSSSYERTKAEVWFATVADAEAAGYIAPRGNHKKAEEAN